MVAFSMKSDGGYLWACKNYDGNLTPPIIAA